MYLLEIIPLAKIPLAQPQIFTYFSAKALAPGALVFIPLNRRKEKGLVLTCEPLEKKKMEIKKAGFELRNISGIISSQPVLTQEQIELALWLGQYYFASPGIFLKMALPKSVKSLKLKVKNYSSKFKVKGNQKLIIAPTIAWAENLVKNEKGAVLWHSGIPSKKSNEIRQKIRRGEIKTVIGTRSAVFLPFINLKKIVIEDETDPSHQSWDMWPHWHARRAAEKLAEIFQAELIFKNGPPSIESYFFNPRSFSNSKHQIDPKIIDLKEERKNGNFSLFSRELQKLIKEALANKKQSILFLNRRGAANFVFCQDCGEVLKCRNCSAPPAFHLLNGRPSLFCHHCGLKQAPPQVCPACQCWRLKNAGGGAQKAETELAKIYSEAKILRLDSDSAPTADQQEKIIESFLKKEADILIATPVFLSWQEKLSRAETELSALISAETIFHLPDFRAGEKAFRIIEALGALTKKHFLIQTYNPENQILEFAAKNRWEEFFKEELETRKILKYPPFSQLVKITFRHKNPQKAGQEAKILKLKLDRANKNPEVEISEALPAFISKEKGKYIWNIILKFPIADPKSRKIDREFLTARDSLLKFTPSNFEIDADPINLL